MKPSVRTASLSLDLDNKWTYMRVHGDAGWESYPSYLSAVVPRILEMFDELRLTTTVFIVGRDATLDENVEAIRAMAKSGHELANHSFNHEPWLHLYTEAQLDAELAAAEVAIQTATGARPRGFRGPGFSITPTVLEVLKRREYDYDASTFPTFLGPLARAYYLARVRMSAAEREKRRQLFGRLGDGLRPLDPYVWDLPGGELVEIPISTIPIVRVPFHLSYILYVASMSQALAQAYFSTALHACRLTGMQPSLLLHPLDFLGGDDVPELRYFPAMGLSGAKKCELTRWVVAEYAKYFDVITLGRHAQLARQDFQEGRRPVVPVRGPRTLRTARLF
jgi:peptidoglycan-N-acetylglucosamine deacetylase